MVSHNKVLAIILGGGKGTRLGPLTKDRCKPAISFGGKYRLIDIPISNCLHSGIHQIFILTQFLTASIHRHIFQTYRLDMLTKGFIEVLPAEQTLADEGWYNGNADAVRRSIRYIRSQTIDHVLILSGDQICQMNYEEILQKHIELDADLTIIGSKVKDDQVSRMGIIEADASGKISQLIEKPEDLKSVEHLKNENGDFIASTGNYIFKRDVLLEILEESTEEDFGQQVIPATIKRGNVYHYPFEGYWRDIGTISSFYDANLELTEPVPEFNLFDRDPIFTRARFLPPAKVQNATVSKALITEGSLIEDATIEDSIIGLRSVIGTGTVIRKSVIIGNDFYEREIQHKEVKPYIGNNVVIEGAIIDKNVVIEDNVKIIGLKGAKNIDEKLYSVRDGIIVIPKRTHIPAGTVIEPA